VIKALRVQLVLKVNVDYQVNQESQDLWVHKEFKALKVNVDYLVHLVLMVR
jgi:hypothetical protein